MFIASAFSMTSCLKAGLEDLPAYSDTEILSFTFSYRYMDSDDKMSLTLMGGDYTIDSSASTVTCNIVVPDASATLPEEQRALVSLENLVGYCSISTAAIIEPIGDSPTLGGMADWSVNPLQYKVIAADGTERTWTIIINSFTK